MPLSGFGRTLVEIQRVARARWGPGVRMVFSVSLDHDINPNGALSCDGWRAMLLSPEGEELVRGECNSGAGAQEALLKAVLDLSREAR